MSAAAAAAAAAIVWPLLAPALSGNLVRSRRGGAATSTPPCFRSCLPRRGHSSSCRSPAPAPAAAATGASADAAGRGDGDGEGGTAVVSYGAAAEEENRTTEEVKAALFQSLQGVRSGDVPRLTSPFRELAVSFSFLGKINYRERWEVRSSLPMQGINRGLFGVQSQKRSEIEGLVQLLEARKPTPHPTDHLHQVGGRWKLLYSTVTILGSKRTKLGLRDFVSLDDISQRIDVAQGKAINEIKFSVRGLKMLSGQLTIVASFRVASKTRVDITFESSDITPEQLMNLFQKNYDLLLAIFNPEGWLEITYVDESIRIGRDNKGNIFVLERAREEQT